VIHPLADVETSHKGSVLRMGQETVIDAFVKIKFTGGLGDIEIGDRCYINSGCVLYSGNGIKIGSEVIIAANTVFAPSNHCFEHLDRPIRDQGFMPSRGGITVGSDVWIGANVVILDGAVIPDGCVIGACSLVRGVLEPYGVYMGNPLKLLKYRQKSGS
jgi:acetyltransferase-like isoleucine patch superfamily enzyme